MSDEQNGLPPGWASVPLSDVCTNKSGNSKLIKGKLCGEPSDGLFPAFSASGQDVWHNGYEHEGAAIILSAVGARCGKAFLADGKWSAIANTHVIRVGGPAEVRDFLFLALNDEHFWVKGGSAQPFVKVGASFERPFSIPPSTSRSASSPRSKPCNFAPRPPRRPSTPSRRCWRSSASRSWPPPSVAI